MLELNDLKHRRAEHFVSPFSNNLYVRKDQFSNQIYLSEEFDQEYRLYNETRANQDEFAKRLQFKRLLHLQMNKVHEKNRTYINL